MKLNLGERLITNNPLRTFIQRRVEGPMLKRMAGLESYPLCLEIGCGRGVGAEIFFEEPLREFTSIFTKDSLFGVIATHPLGVMFSFDEFNDELRENNVDIEVDPFVKTIFSKN
jgi:hypothetical protein